jgi:RNA polymerase sigma-70 factor (ECF subfamily)
MIRGERAEGAGREEHPVKDRWSGGVSRVGPRYPSAGGDSLTERTDPPPRAFEELLAQHVDPLYRTALRLAGGRPADAEDLLQDACLRAFERFGSLRRAEAGRSWLFTILIRTHLNRERSRRRRPETLEADLEEGAFELALARWPSATPEDIFAREQLADQLRAAIGTLDGDLRAVVCLVDVEGFSHREVAEMLRVPEGTVASRLFRARRELRDRLATTAHEGFHRRQQR